MASRRKDRRLTQLFTVRIPKSFQKRLNEKEAPLQKAIMKCIKFLQTDPRHPGLHTHRVKGTDKVWEAYVDDGNRLTWRWGTERETIELLNHCNHDILNSPYG